MFKAVIIDDEENARLSLYNLLTNYCKGIGTIEMAESADSGYQLIQEFEPDVVFLDVEMPGGNGFDLLQRFDKVNFEVIFTTAYGHYAIEAIRCSALDYLLKPVDVDELINAVGRMSEKDEMQSGTPVDPLKMEALFENVKSKEKLVRVLIASMEGYDILRREEIIYCQSDNAYTEVYTSDGKRYVSTQQLSNFESMLSNSGFFRVNRSFLVNGEHIKSYQKGNGGTVILSNGYEIDVSRRKKASFLEFLLEQRG